MATKFEMSDLGKLTYYLGIEVLQSDEGITLKQDRYARKILEETRMSLCNLTHVPMEMNAKFSKEPNEEKIDEKEYRRSIGCLRYLLHTRPDLSFSVRVLSRYMQAPCASHGSALKQNEQIEVEHIPGSEQNADILTKSLGRVRFKGMRDLIGVRDVSEDRFKLKGENVG
ncbi:uncharacterized mitochondrial protein AtMg00810-like [Brassica napus]|uniref:uncharacterized mitochondrial protein AtMg00810-like n=1 Tax=Brassica napus TaxID=3708 RepID=UPI000BBF12AA|nr:uncharacterized mitochondrial protein AtMg00810-like [Brassica napus]